MSQNESEIKTENAYRHWKQSPCLCRHCSLFRLIVKSWHNIDFMIAFKKGFEEYWNVFKKMEIKNNDNETT